MSPSRRTGPSPSRRTVPSPSRRTVPSPSRRTVLLGAAAGALGVGAALAGVETELLPRVAEAGPTTHRIGVLGWSMGGCGALLLARESAAGRLAGCTGVAAAASSPALFGSAGATAPGAFDDPADWTRWGDLARDPATAGTALHVSCGTGDPFEGQTRRYRAAARPTPSGGLGPGRHDDGYWRTRLPEQLDFLGRALAAAGVTARR